MAFFLLSKLSRFKNAAFSQVPKSQILSHLCSRNDANFMFPRWAADARAFSCRKLNEVDGGGGMGSIVLAMKRKVKEKVKGKSDDETAGNAEDARSILSLCKVERVSDIILYPPEVLDNEDRIVFVNCLQLGWPSFINIMLPREKRRGDLKILSTMCFASVGKTGISIAKDV